eukprot:2754581-Ditylum_brightwellii.AAC.1
MMKLSGAPSYFITYSKPFGPSLSVLIPITLVNFDAVPTTNLGTFNCDALDLLCCLKDVHRRELM